MESIIAIGVSVLVTMVIVISSFVIVGVCDSCNHSYERIDTCNDKKMILVCRRCGKIKKLRK